MGKLARLRVLVPDGLAAPVGRVQRQILQVQVRIGAIDDEGDIGHQRIARLCYPIERRLAPAGDLVIALDLRCAVALAELGAVRRPVFQIVHVERRVIDERVVAVVAPDGRIERPRQDSRAGRAWAFKRTRPSSGDSLSFVKSGGSPSGVPLMVGWTASL